MVQIVIVNKFGLLKVSGLKNPNRQELYKKAGFKKSEGFDHRTSWSVFLGKDKIEIELWAREDGKWGTENKYDFPPPVDTVLYYGNCLLLRRDPDTQDPVNLTLDIWGKTYDKLFGGFDDLAEEDPSSEDELATVDQRLKTRHGYLKDGFICDDGGMSPFDEEDEEGDDELGEGDDNIIIETTNPRNRSRLKPTLQSDSEEDDGENWIDGAELAPEKYSYSTEED